MSNMRAPINSNMDGYDSLVEGGGLGLPFSPIDPERAEGEPTRASAEKLYKDIKELEERLHSCLYYCLKLGIAAAAMAGSIMSFMFGIQQRIKEFVNSTELKDFQKTNRPDGAGSCATLFDPVAEEEKYLLPNMAVTACKDAATRMGPPCSTTLNPVCDLLSKGMSPGFVVGVFACGIGGVCLLLCAIGSIRDRCKLKNEEVNDTVDRISRRSSEYGLHVSAEDRPESVLKQLKAQAAILRNKFRLLPPPAPERGGLNPQALAVALPLACNCSI